MNSSGRYPFQIWRPAWDIFLCYGPIFAVIFLSEQSFVFYPVAMLVIANRLLALSLICHEGLHGTLFEKPRWNDFVGRWFCAFPTMISFSKYRRMHLMHHRALGHHRWDPDLHLYNFYPTSASRYIVDSITQLFQFKTCLSFTRYYTELPELWEICRTRRFSDLKPTAGVFKENDILAFLIFFVGSISVAVWAGLGREVFLYWTLPLVFITQPYVLLMGGLQHGPIPLEGAVEERSRSIRGPKWLMEILLPLDINYHGEHHFNPSVPHYWLKTLAKDLEGKTKIWEATYGEALLDLFASKTTTLPRPLQPPIRHYSYPVLEGPALKGVCPSDGHCNL